MTKELPTADEFGDWVADIYDSVSEEAKQWLAETMQVFWTSAMVQTVPGLREQLPGMVKARLKSELGEPN